MAEFEPLRFEEDESLGLERMAAQLALFDGRGWDRLTERWRHEYIWRAEMMIAAGTGQELVDPTGGWGIELVPGKGGVPGLVLVQVSGKESDSA